MSPSQDIQIQIQFLEETTHYLNTLETVLLSLQANNSIDLQNINAALQVTHSIKSDAGIMGFRILSDLAHRLSDSFQVLKALRKSLEIDTDLHSLLLCGVDWLRHIVELLSVGYVIDEQWLAVFCYPVFEELHQRLGDSNSEEAMTILLPQERPRDIIHLLFQTEVEECLQRLESLLADREFLREELVIMAAELGGLGEMLQLPAFTQLCKSIIEHLEADEAVAEIAQLALETWRQSQALILTNQIDSLPTEINRTCLCKPQTNNLKQIRGDMKVDTAPEVETTFTLSMPFTLSQTPVLLVESNQILLAFPADVVEEICLLDNQLVFPLVKSEFVNWQNSIVQLIRLNHYLQFNCQRPKTSTLETSSTIHAACMIIVKNGNQRVAVQVDRICGEQEVVIRPAQGNIPLPAGFSSCTILNDGRIVPVVNINELLHLIDTSDITSNSNQWESTQLITPNQEDSILIANDSINVGRCYCDL